MEIQLSDRWAKYLGGRYSGCSGCQARRSKLIQFASNKASVLFSGGLDSTYAAIKMREAGKKVALFTIDWQVVGKEPMAEFTRAQEIAELLDMPLHVLGHWQETREAEVMRVPTLMNAVLSHRGLMVVGDLVFGGHPSTYNLDAKWVAFGEAVAAVVRPGTKILAPCDGVSRRDMMSAIPAEIRPLLFCCYDTTPDGARCGNCEKCNEDLPVSV